MYLSNLILMCPPISRTAIAQTIAEWERRKEKLWKELDFALADVITW